MNGSTTTLMRLYCKLRGRDFKQYKENYKWLDKGKKKIVRDAIKNYLLHVD